MDPTTNPASALVDVLKLIPLAKRRQYREQIDLLCLTLKTPNVFMENFLSTNKEVRSRLTKQTTELKKAHMPRYWLEGRVYLDRNPATLAEAADAMRVSENSLRIRVNSTKSFSKLSDYTIRLGFSSDEDIVTCSKMTQDELDEQLAIFNEKYKNGGGESFTVQSKLPTPKRW